jgi:hypothetical protein
MTQRRRSFAVLRRSLVLSTALGLCVAQAAAEPTATELVVARRLFDEARGLEEAQRWELAAAKLNDALLIKETPGLRFHLAHCLEKLGQLVEANLEYGRAQDLIAAGAKAPDVEDLLAKARSSLEARIPSLLIVAPAEVPGLQLELNGRAVARSVLGRRAPVNPGTHSIWIRAAGYQDFREEVSIQEGERRTVSVELVPATALEGPVPGPVKQRARRAAVKPRIERNTSVSTRTYVLVAETAWTLASVGVGVGFFFVKKTEKRTVARAQARADSVSETPGGSACNAPQVSRPLRESCADLNQAISNYDRARFLSTAGFVGAGVGAAAALLTIALWPGENAPAASLSVHPEQRWVSVSGRF